MGNVRLFLYRYFNIRAIVTMPRNIFIDTPTLTSLLFAQKKTADQIADWDITWQDELARVETQIKAAAKSLRKDFAMSNSGETVSTAFLSALSPTIKPTDWVSKGGKSPALMPMTVDWKGCDGEQAAAYYREILKTAGFDNLCQNHIFSRVSSAKNYEFPVFMVDEIGYKLSKRKEKARPNQLCLFRGRQSKQILTNLHLAEEPCDVILNKLAADTVLSQLQKSIKWSDA